ncbi:MAG: MATE family efflux transporter [Gammaproteobacteria bacterium]|nr:MATE family efflux transporter [Gammaproteobacteria bacterium]
MDFRGEIKALVKLGAPMVVTQFFIMAMGFLDTAMAGHYSARDLAGVALGGNVLWPVFMLMTGFTMAITPIVSQLRGANREDSIGGVVRQGLWIALVSSVVTALVITEAEPIFRWAGVDAAAADVAIRYLEAAAWGMPAVMVYITLRYASEGLGHTLPPMLIVTVALVLNGFLNYVLIYGKFGLPELGGEGCGWATAIVMWFELILMLCVLRMAYFRRTGITDRFEGPRARDIGRILKVGIPIGLTAFLNMTVFAVVGFLIGSLGIVPLAAHSIAGNVNWATFVIPMGLGSAASIRVGVFVGARNFEASRQVAKVAVLMSLTYAVVVSIALFASRHWLVTVYSNDGEVVSLAAALILFVVIYQIVDDSKETMAGALRGYKDTRAPLVYSLVGYWLIALPLGSALGYGWFGLDPLGVYGFWVGLGAGMSLVAGCLGYRLWSTTRDEDRIVRLGAV